MDPSSNSVLDTLFLIYQVSFSLQVKSNFHYLLTQIANIFCKWLYPKNQMKVIPAFQIKIQVEIDNFL